MSEPPLHVECFPAQLERSSPPGPCRPVSGKLPVSNHPVQEDAHVPEAASDDGDRAGCHADWVAMAMRLTVS